MNRVSLLAACVAGLSGIVAYSHSRAQGPGEGGAVVKQPWDTTPAGLPGFGQQQRPGSPKDLPAFAQPNPLGHSPADSGLRTTIFTEYKEGPDPNFDIRVTPEAGPWMVCVHWYSGPDAARMARDFVLELRNRYKLPACVFNRGAEERKAEFERIRKLQLHQKELRDKTPGGIYVPGRIPVPMRIEDQCAILIGGYKDDESAKKGLEKIRKLAPPDPKAVKLATGHFEKMDPKTKQVKQAVFTINPFTKAMLVRNPTVKQERPADWDKIDMTLLKKLNRDEPLSLLECKKPFTLAIKQFHTPTTVQPASATGRFLENLGLGKASERVDTAAVNAHNMADLMRKTELDAYVLHTKFASIVSVGGYDSPDDPALKSMQRYLVETMRLPTTPMPMQVPR